MFDFQIMSDNFENSLRLLLKRCDAGKILGINVRNMKDIRQCSGAKIHLDKQCGIERVMTITGDLENVMKATDLVMLSLEGDKSVLGRKSLKLMLPDS